MGSRGRGRGRGLSFNIESLGFGRGEVLPSAVQQPPPVFPPLEFKAALLETSEECDYVMALKQEFRGAIRDSPFFIKPLEKKRDIDRYSDKYQLNQNGESNIKWTPDWKRFPAELAIKKKKDKKLAAVIKEKNLKNKKLLKSIDKTIEELEKKESEEKQETEDGQDAESGKSGDEDEENEEVEEEVLDEEEIEEETDYNLNYFDNGEFYGMDDEDDNLDDGPVY